MNITSLALILMLAAGLSACENNQQNQASIPARTIKDESLCREPQKSQLKNQIVNQNGAIFHYTLPEGWRVSEVCTVDYENIIYPINKSNSAGITIDFHNRRYTSYVETENGCAKKFLQDERRFKDEKIRMSKVGAINSPKYGKVTQYRYVSEYYGDHLISFIPTPDGVIKAELWAESAKGRESNTALFQELVKSIDIIQ